MKNIVQIRPASAQLCVDRVSAVGIGYSFGGLPMASSSGASSSGLSSSGTPSPRSQTSQSDSEQGGGHYSLDGLATTWDNSEIIRDRLREHQQLTRSFDVKSQKLVDQYVERSLVNLKHNVEVLSPVLKLMQANKGVVPAIDRIIEQVDILYKKAKHPGGKGDRLYQEGWAVRRLCAYAKSITYKPHPPKELAFMIPWLVNSCFETWVSINFGFGVEISTPKKYQVFLFLHLYTELPQYRYTDLHHGYFQGQPWGIYTRTLQL